MRPPAPARSAIRTAPVPGAAEPRSSRVGDYALSSGVVAAVATFVPVIGEVLAIPAAMLAVGLGLVGVRSFETGRTRHFVPAVVGIVLGALAAFGAFMVLASSALHG